MLPRESVLPLGVTIQLGLMIYFLEEASLIWGRPTTGCGARSTSLWVHRNLFWQLTETCMVRHVTRQDSLSKTIPQGTAEGGRRRGRQRKWWMDNIKELTSLPMPELLTRASCRKDWKRISAESSLMPPSLPRRPNRSRD